jgi:hypothetical protein
MALTFFLHRYWGFDQQNIRFKNSFQVGYALCKKPDYVFSSNEKLH